MHHNTVGIKHVSISNSIHLWYRNEMKIFNLKTDVVVCEKKLKKLSNT